MGSSDRCEHIKSFCSDLLPGLIDYYSFIFCSLSGFEAAGFFILILWLFLLFLFVGMVAGEYFSPNVASVTRLLKIPQDIAGVTFVAMGNAANDMAATLISFSRPQLAQLAFGSLLGSGAFMACVVCGSVFILHGNAPFSISRRSMFRDILVYMVGITLALMNVAIGVMNWWKGMLHILFYCFYVIVILSMTNVHLRNWALRLLFCKKIKIDRQESEEEPVELPTICPKILIESPHDGDDEVNQETSESPTGDKPKIFIEDDLQISPGTSKEHQSGKIGTSNFLSLDRLEISPQALSSQISPTLRSYSDNPSAFDRKLLSPTTIFSVSSQSTTSPSNSVRSRNGDGMSFNSDKSSIDESVSEKIVGFSQRRILHRRQNYSVQSAMETLGALKLLSASNSPTEEFGMSQSFKSDTSPNHGITTGYFGNASRSPSSIRTISSNSSFKSYFDCITALELNDYCPICSKVTSSHDQETFATLWKHFLPLYFLWNIYGLFGKLLGLINFIPSIIFSLSIPVIVLPEKHEINIDTPRFAFEYAESGSPDATDARDNGDMRDIEVFLGLGSFARGKKGRNGCSRGRVAWVPWRHRFLNLFQLFIAPIFILFVISPSSGDINGNFPAWALALLIGLILSGSTWAFSRNGKRLVRLIRHNRLCTDDSCVFCLSDRSFDFRKTLKLSKNLKYWENMQFYPYLSVLGCVTGLMWIYLISAEIVSLLHVIGRSFSISDSILGITIFALGNCIGDFVTNLTLARVGLAPMAIGATWGALIFNIFLTFGVGIIIMSFQNIKIQLYPITVAAIIGIYIVSISQLVVFKFFSDLVRPRSFGFALLGMWVVILVVSILTDSLWS